MPVGLVCEDGKYFREFGIGARWANLSQNFDTDWQEAVINVLDVWTSLAAGSAMEAGDLSIM